MIPPDALKLTLAKIATMTVEKVDHHWENPWLHKDGHSVYFSWSGVLDNDIFYAIGTDITDREIERQKMVEQLKNI